MTRAALPYLAPLALAAAACSSEPPCTLAVWFRADAAKAQAGADPETAELIGSWDGWKRPGKTEWTRRRSADGVEWLGAALPLPEGRHHYAIALGGTLLLDEANPASAFVADPLGRDAAPEATEVSEAELLRCGQPALTGLSLSSADGFGLSASAVFTPGAEGAALESASAVVRRAGEVVAEPEVTAMAGEGTWTLRADLSGLAPGKYALTLTARDAEGAEVSGAASAFVEPDGRAWRRALSDGLVYQIVTDRFRGPGALKAPASPGDRAGGTLDGVREAVEAGYFAKLGVSTLWLSPVYANPKGRFPGRDGRQYEAYHGYWPAEPRAVDPALGGEAALDALVAAAHARGLRIVLDVVPNHLFEGHPYFAGHSTAAAGLAGSWFNDGPDSCVCGAPGCDWGARMLDCWFAPYLPDLDWRKAAVAEAGVADIRWWAERFDLDGLRIDAVPMMPRAASRRIARAFRSVAARGGLDALVLGEVYTAGGDGGRAEIRAYLGTGLDGLDSAFDFPTMWALRETVAHGGRGFDWLERELAAAEAAWEGSGSTAARMLGNHDTTRFLSEAAGDAGGDPWTLAPPQPSGDAPYRKHLMALAWTLTAPGLPVLYYGDEVGLAGATDPDSRRVLPDVLSGELAAPQARMLRDVAALGSARACLPALRQGSREALLLEADRAVVLRRSGDASGSALVALSRGSSDSEVEVHGVPDGAWIDLLSGRRFASASGSARLALPAMSASLYLQEDSPCR